MCRFALYLGQTITLGSLVTEPTNSIINQSFNNLEVGFHHNGDGFGVAWYAEGHEQPVHFREVLPAWSSMNLRQLARVTKSRCILAHVRAASPGLAVTQLNCHPFVRGPVAFMHNGDVPHFRAIRRALQAELSQEAYDAIEGTTDSEHTFALFMDAYRASKEADPLERLATCLLKAIERIETLHRPHETDEPCQLNLCVSDGKNAVVSRFVSDAGGSSNSLYVHEGQRYVCNDGVCQMSASAQGSNGAVIVSSEPLSEDPGWRSVPENHLVLVSADLGVALRPITLASLSSGVS